jgi:hypothetical protein
VPPRRWELRVEDILEAIGRIAEYVRGLDFERFVADRRTIDAVVRNYALTQKRHGMFRQTFKPVTRRSRGRTCVRCGTS